MANNPLTTGPNATSGAGENSTSPLQTWDAQQQRIQEAFQAREAAQTAAVEAKNAAARNRSSGAGAKPSGFEATGNVTYNTHGNPPVGLPKRGRKG